LYKSCEIKEMSLHVLHSCPYPIKYPPHGGLHRSEQVAEILLRYGISVTDLSQVPLSQKRPLVTRIIGAVNSLQDQDWDAFRSRRLGGIGQTFDLYNQEFAKGKNYQALIWETVLESVTPKMGKKYNVPVIALPQNLESFYKIIFQKESLSKAFDYLKLEVGTLKLADSVFAISAEEQIFLRNFGIEADYLPYYPPQRLIDFYSQIRDERKKVEKDGLLILGSANNELTREGIIELISWIHLMGDKHVNPITLLGNQTESLVNALPYPWLKFCGTATQEELKQHLIETKAVLIHQRRGLGALTRIPEMLIAGIPIIANRVAARSATHFSGVHVYDCAEELHVLLNLSFTETSLPPPPMHAEQRFVQAALMS
jgi:hypothetical protein